jgi:hypothetical protein
VSVLVIIFRISAASVLALSLTAAPKASGASATDSCLWRTSVIDVYHEHVGPRWRVDRAMRIWNDVRQGQPRLRSVTTKAAADVVVSPYRSYATDMNGWTLNYCDRDHTTRSTVRLNAARPLDRQARARVTVHELGHVLGLRHRPYSPYPTIMRPSLWGCTAYPSLLDRRTLGTIY